MEQPAGGGKYGTVGKNGEYWAHCCWTATGMPSGGIDLSMKNPYTADESAETDRNVAKSIINTTVSIEQNDLERGVAVNDVDGGCFGCLYCTSANSKLAIVTDDDESMWSSVAVRLVVGNV